MLDNSLNQSLQLALFQPKGLTQKCAMTQDNGANQSKPSDLTLMAIAKMGTARQNNSLDQSIQTDLFPLIGIAEMCTTLQKSRATIHRWVQAKKLIAPVYRNGRTLGWCPNQFKRWRTSQSRHIQS